MTVSRLHEGLVSVCLLASVLAFPPAVAVAQQGGVGGVVRDPTGGVLPGVTVEAASPALIERVRTTVTGSAGRYQITNLRPGTYVLTFTLPGFSTLLREGVELTSGFTATVNAELTVGAVEESVTVTGAAPLIDVQNVLAQTVLRPEVLTSMPIGRDLSGYASLTVGLRTGGVSSASPDVGGTVGVGNISLATHGSRDTDMHLLYDGVNTQNWTQDGGGQGRQMFYNVAYVDEVVLNKSSASADAETGGVTLNVIPRDGGNQFSGLFGFDGTTSDLQSGNVDDELRAQGLRDLPGLDYLYDLNGGVGGPIVQDKLWFYAAARRVAAWQFAANNQENLTPNTLFYEPDFSNQARLAKNAWDRSLRVTWQVNAKNKLNISGLFDGTCSCWSAVTRNRRPEAAYSSQHAIRWTQVGWTAPVTNRLLFSVKGNYAWDQQEIAPWEGTLTTTIPVADASTGFTHGSNPNFGSTAQSRDGVSLHTGLRFDASATYVTGSHTLKVGVMNTSGSLGQDGVGPVTDVSYRFACAQPGCAPQRITQIATPDTWESSVSLNMGVYAQDQWTVNRLTLNLGVRLDVFRGGSSAQMRPATFFTPSVSVDEISGTPSWNDWQPRLGVAYDLFGDGLTALKASFGRYAIGQGITIAQRNNPAWQVIKTTNRTWSDANGDYVPDCDLFDTQANGECGRISNLAFGTSRPSATYDPAFLEGWGVRPATNQTAVQLQHELTPGVIAEVGYFRTWYTNFDATRNVAISAADFDPYCITVPTDGRLPGGGGNEICGFFDITPTAFGQVENVIGAIDDASEVHDSIDVTLNARFGEAIITGGVGTTRTVTDNCGGEGRDPSIAVALPPRTAPTTFRSGPNMSTDFCNRTFSWGGQTHFKAGVVYPLPLDFQISGVFQSLPGFPISSSYVATNAEIAPSLGRNLGRCGTAATCTGTATLTTIVPPYSMFTDRVNQMDLRLTKNFRIEGVRIRGNVDLYNLFNSNTVTRVNTRFGSAWLGPLNIHQGRLLKFGGIVEF